MPSRFWKDPAVRERSPRFSRESGGNRASWTITAKKAITRVSRGYFRKGRVCSGTPVIFIWGPPPRVLNTQFINFSAHVVGERPCGSQPTATICVVWSWRFKGCFAPPSACRADYIALSVPSLPDAMPCWWGNSYPQLPWMSACVRYCPDRVLEFECVTCLYRLLPNLNVRSHLTALTCWLCTSSAPVLFTSSMHQFWQISSWYCLISTTFIMPL